MGNVAQVEIVQVMRIIVVVAVVDVVEVMTYTVDCVVNWPDCNDPVS
jgi:hypothetical protein